MTEPLINLPFTKTDGVNTLHDALNLTQAEIDALGEAGLEAMRQQRFDNWIVVLTTPVPETEEQFDG